MFNLRPATPALFTPGAVNSVTNTLAPIPPLWINEVQPLNVRTRAANSGQYEPWVELYNAGSNAVNLQGLYLAGSFTDLTQWAFPSNASVAAHEFKVIFCDGQTDRSTLSELHSNFRLDGTNGMIALSRLQSGQPAILDYVNYRAEYKDALEAPLWTELAPAQVASGEVMSVPDVLSGLTTQCFYRVVTVNH